MCARAGIVSARGRTGIPSGFGWATISEPKPKPKYVMLYHLFLYCGTARAMNTKYTAYVIDRSLVVDVERGEDAVEHGDAVAGELAAKIRVSREFELESVASRRFLRAFATARRRVHRHRTFQQSRDLPSRGVVGT